VGSSSSQAIQGVDRETSASETRPLGFLCLVSCERDRPVRPSRGELEALCALKDVARFVQSPDE